MSSVKPVVDLLRANTDYLHRAIRGIKEEDLTRRPEGRANSIRFIIGHLTSTRFSLARVSGLDLTNPWEEIFGRSSSKEPEQAYPSVASLVESWNEISEKMLVRLDGMSEEELSAEIAFKLPGPESTVRGAVSFFLFHEGYHLGQLGYIRRLLGYESLFG